MYHSVRQVQSPPKTSHRIKAKLWGFAAVLLVGMFIFETMPSHAAMTGSAIHAGNGYCLDDYKTRLIANNTIDTWSCNNSAAQEWTVSDTTISRAGNYCLGVKGNDTAPQSKVVLNPCDQSPGQVWLRDQGGYENPNSGLCLTVPNNAEKTALVINSCSNLSNKSATWTPTHRTASTCQGLPQGNAVACYAIQEWTTWQATSSNHAALLSGYTDGNGYEEWCADFVSYVYREAGHSFSQGERSDWDEYDANNVQHMGFTAHDASSGYTPRAGDVAYFSYNGGHVEVVVSGGEHPTFVYGDSATPDPQTGNGDMQANTITHDGDFGRVIYYLSPN